MFEIRKGIKPPRYKSEEYPFADMQIGDSFIATDVNRKVLASTAQRKGDKLGAKFSIRKVPEGLGVWRVK